MAAAEPPTKRGRTEALLRTPPPPSFIKTRPAPGGQRDASGKPKSLSYLNVDQAMVLANHAFGWDGWTTEVKILGQVETTEQNKNKVVYLAHARVTHLESEAFHEDVGTGDGMGELGQAHDTAYKSAASDAIKRALRQFGEGVGLNLGRK